MEDTNKEVKEQMDNKIEDNAEQLEETSVESEVKENTNIEKNIEDANVDISEEDVDNSTESSKEDSIDEPFGEKPERNTEETYKEDISDEEDEEDEEDNSIISKIRSLLETDRLIFGSSEVNKALQEGKLEAVVITSNLPDMDKEQFRHYSEISNVELFELEETNEQLGLICKKPFNIAVLGIVKEN
jgi:ribosomal protein L30E